MLHIGCHLSSADGFLAMGKTALGIGADTFQFFTRNPRGSKAKAIDPADAAALMKLIRKSPPQHTYYQGILDAYRSLGLSRQVRTVLRPALERSLSRGR